MIGGRERLQQIKAKGFALNDNKEKIEIERERLYMIVKQIGLCGKLTIKQSHVLDEHIVQDLINQLEKNSVINDAADMTKQFRV